MSIARLAHWMTGIGLSKVWSLPPKGSTTLQSFLFMVSQWANGKRRSGDVQAQIEKIKNAAKAADRHADSIDAATKIAKAESAKEKFNNSRQLLYSELVGLKKFRFWARRRSFWTEDKSVGPNGCGLLNVQTWIQQRDPSIFKVLLELQNELLRKKSKKLPDLLWCLEARCFVFPEKGSLHALLVSMSDTAIQWDETWAKKLIDSLRVDDFWIPAGTKSLDELRSKLFPEPADTAAVELLPEEGEVGTELAKEEYKWEWAKLRDTLKDSNDEDKKKLRQILAFRKKLTDALMVKAVELVAKKKHGKFNLYRSLRYSAPGSTRLTSDIDVNMRGSASELVAIEFNRLFREWTVTGEPKPEIELESGYVFDVNVYAQDYTREFGLRFMKADVPDQDFWPATGTKHRADAERWQDIYALMKMRRYMEDDAWNKFRYGVFAGLRRPLGSRQQTNEPKLRPSMAQATNELLDEVDRLWAVQKGQAEAAKKEVLGLPNHGQYPANAKMRAENNRYEKQLKKVCDLRGTGAPLTDKKKVELAQALGKAMFLAQEAYHSAGAVRDVVSNLQMGRGLKLSMQEQLHSLNEQVGDIYKELGHFPPPLEGDVTIDFAVNASKYIVRLASAALSANYNLVTKILEAQLPQVAADVQVPANTPKEGRGLAAQNAYAGGLARRLNALLDLQESFNTWREKTLNLMAIKDNPDRHKEDGAWNDDARALLDNAPWKQFGTFSEVLQDLAVTMNVQARTDPAATMRLGLTGDSVRAVRNRQSTAWV